MEKNCGSTAPFTVDKPLTQPMVRLCLPFIKPRPMRKPLPVGTKVLSTAEPTILPEQRLKALASEKTQHGLALLLVCRYGCHYEVTATG